MLFMHQKWRNLSVIIPVPKLTTVLQSLNFGAGAPDKVEQLRANGRILMELWNE